MAPLPPYRSEREAICDLFVELGPDAPTLDEGWTTTDLAAHLYVREHSLKGGVGILVPQVSGWHDDAIARTKDARTYAEIVEAVRSGPPFGPFRLLDAQINLQEMFVHHEDARRGGGDTTPRPTDEIAEVEAALWTSFHRMHRMATRNVKGVRLELINSEHPDDTIDAGHGDDTVQVVGRPGEIVLYLLGRTEAAHVELIGSDAAVATLESCTLGI